MPLNFTQVKAKLEDKKKEFKTFDEEFKKEINLLEIASGYVFNQDYDALMHDLDGKNDCGAIPSEEYQSGLLIKCPDSPKFTTLQAMTAWAVKYVKNKTFVASDGSQIYPSDEFNVPISVVQVAWFKNPHRLDQTHEKLTDVDILTPLELLVKTPDKATGMEKALISQEPVNTRRFEMEMDILKKEMLKIAADPNKQPAFFVSDGSLILSFIQNVYVDYQKKYWNSIKSALDQSIACKLPLIGYVDTSHAKDVANMIRVLQVNALNDVRYISDATILEKYIQKTLGYTMLLGDRTCGFICQRDEPIYRDFYLKNGDKYKIAFFYIKLNMGQLARVEFPKWCLDVPGLTDEIASMILADAILGAGYPYTTDQCHHLAVIEGQDRLKFFRLFEEFSTEIPIPFKMHNKARSKVRRF